MLKDFEKSLRYENCKYSARLPWKPNCKKLPNNYSLALSRLFATLNGLRRQPELLKTYDTIIQNQLERDFIELVSNPKNDEGILHYLPHHAVKKDSLRVAYDCSAKTSKN